MNTTDYPEPQFINFEFKTNKFKYIMKYYIGFKIINLKCLSIKDSNEVWQDRYSLPYDFNKLSGYHNKHVIKWLFKTVDKMNRIKAFI